MSHPTPSTPSRGAPLWTMPSDLESGTGLVNLIGTAAKVLGREVTTPADHADLDVARQLLELLGLVPVDHSTVVRDTKVVQTAPPDKVTGSDGNTASDAVPEQEDQGAR